MEQKYEALFAKGTLIHTSAKLKEMGLSDHPAEYLVRLGLPVFDAHEPPFGLLFCEALQLNHPHKKYIVIGREIWAESLYVAIEPETGVVWAVTDNSADNPVYMNASVVLLLEFMDLVLKFRKQAASFSADPPPKIWTAEQARLRLEKFRRGEIKPQVNQDQTAALEHEREASFQKLKRELRVLDPSALHRSSWWSKVLEEIGYPLL